MQYGYSKHNRSIDTNQFHGLHTENGVIGTTKELSIITRTHLLLTHSGLGRYRDDNFKQTHKPMNHVHGDQEDAHVDQGQTPRTLPRGGK